MVEQEQTSLELLAYAKVNLTLDVGRLRSDGYHEINSVMQTINLADTLILSAAPEGITVSCTPSGAAPDGPANLAYRALESLADRIAPAGVDLRIIKRIPTAAGLGGGSSDAATALKAANALFKLNLTEVELISLAARLGSDVAFFIRGGTALAQGRGETVTVLPTLRPQWLVLVKPEFQVATAEIYSRYQPGQNRTWTTWFMAAVSRSDRDGMLANMGNDLEPVAAAAHPQVSVLIKRLEGLGAERALMSGSGPTVFGVFPGEEEARAAARQLDGGGEQVFVCRMIRPGEHSTG
jgi:4-diphosphocytidyl-2-C-methyl-D-erythritol kinase